MPAVEEALPRFRAAHTQVLGVSIDSVHCHANWARDLGGVSFPLLSDFEPKGAVARSLGHYLPDAGITDRASVFIDRAGAVRYSVSVTPAGQRDIGELAKECESMDRGQSGGDLAPAQGIPDGTLLYVKSRCGHSRRCLVALDNLHLRDVVKVLNVSTDASAKADLLRVGGKDQAPCLVMGGQAHYESADLIRQLAERTAPLA